MGNFGLERQQLHRMLANGRTWIFGEQYTLAVDDKGLTKVLEAHRALLSDDTPISRPVTDLDGHTRIVDLMLSKATHFADRRQHLVVELKRPRLKLSQTELGQITNYAVAVSRDDRFKTPDVSWDFWLLGDDTGWCSVSLVSITRPITTPATMSAPANVSAEAALWKVAPLVNVSSTRRTCSPSRLPVAR